MLESEREKVGRSIRVMRAMMGMKQIDLARDVGVSVNWLSIVEQGHRDIGLGVLIRIAEAGNMTLVELLGLGEHVYARPPQ